MAGSLGAIWIAFGMNAQTEAAKSKKSFLEYNRFPTRVLTDASFPTPKDLTTDQKAHWAKVNADLWSPYDYTLLLDADTRVKGNLSLGFKILRDGWEIVLIPSIPPLPGIFLWTLSGTEKRGTLEELGTWKHMMLNTGVMYFQKTCRVRKLFEAWRSEWLRYKDRDQGAFLRALRYCPVNLWLLGSPFNSAEGDVVEHLFGRAR